MLKGLWNQARRAKKRLKKRLMYRGTHEEVFTRLYKRNVWGSKESVSGPGSELSYTECLRRQLPQLLRQYCVSRVLDAPCGDFNWMRHVVPDLGIEYIGGDIVKEIVVRNQQEFGTNGVSFRQLDIVRDPLPASELMMVRDCLIHLSYREIYGFLVNFCQSNTGLLLTTTHLPDDGENSDIQTGDVRSIHLFSPPFCFPQPPLQRLNDWIPPHQEREMCLFTKSQAEVARQAMKRFLN